MADIDVKVNCSNCKYFVGENAVLGVCKRYPNAINKHDKDWCGEFTWELKEYRDNLTKFFEANPDYANSVIEGKEVKIPKKRGRKPKNATPFA